jgi:RHH-type proline utilization regulon transcriptional repressor/proline dehydrogenase/delta 1-pyrroline-5-carboxylate dehydrogenase
MDSTLDAARARIRASYRADETACVRSLLANPGLTGDARARVNTRAIELVERVRAAGSAFAGIDTLLAEFNLSSKEGVVLMCLAEALLRIPDKDTLDRFITDKLSAADWRDHLGGDNAWFVNAATWMLIVTGDIIAQEDSDPPASQFERLLARLGKPIARQAMVQAMRILGGQFILGRSIEEALDEAEFSNDVEYRCSFDMLGESARTREDAARYFASYATAIEAIGRRGAALDPSRAHGISVKLSALHPRYEPHQRDRLARELAPRLAELARLARSARIGLTIDAEEANRLEPSLDLLERLRKDPALDGWEGLGLAVQAYQKRAPHVVEWLVQLARTTRHRIMVRLVKGAYWDSEIKRAQENGLDGYPVYTRKCSTDLSYIACAARMLQAGNALYSQFATHNAHTVAAIAELAGERTDFEFQRLHGMGGALYRIVVGGELGRAYPCRTYAPVGDHASLLPYLVRRLLENGANTSFVNRIADARRPAHEVVSDPFDIAAKLTVLPHPQIPLPRDLFQPERVAAKSFDLSDTCDLARLYDAMKPTLTHPWVAMPMTVGEHAAGGETQAIVDPADHRRLVGHVTCATGADIENALSAATSALTRWDAIGADQRARCLDAMAQALEAELPTFMALAIREAGKTVPDAMAEVREAIDFCRYYAHRARHDLASRALPGPTGERNEISWHGRGVFACISPWNFPLAIFVGQLAAALVAGNCVIAKPAEQTPLIAALAVDRLHRAGVPRDVLQLLPGTGEVVGARLVTDPRIAGVVFTGSVATAQRINRALAARGGPIGTLIAETGGQNAMIVDSTALPEQVVDDVITSAFRSAGQRCSALRVLFLQAEIADRIIGLIEGAAAELTIGDPFDPTTDVGPVIDADAATALAAHIERMQREARLVYAGTLPPACEHGTFIAPHAFEIAGLHVLADEVFGPVLHIVRYHADHLDRVIDAINATRFGLTAGIHTRIDAKAREIQARLRVGNIYINRGMIGAAVGSQPFGGEGLSGTGPKAGGPHYLYRFATERVLSVNTTASGGNASLATLGD